MLHVQEPVSGWLEAVQRLPDTALVKAMSVQWLAEAKATRPGVFTNLRYVNDGLQVVSSGDTEEIREQRARDWFNRFIDFTFLNESTSGWEHWKATNSISWWNEYYANSQSAAEKELWWRQERAAARVWKNEYRDGPNAAKLQGIRLVIASTAVGNDIPWQTAQTAELYDCIVDYHAYDHFTGLNQRDPGSWQFHCGRWNSMDASFRSLGYTVDWLFGEAGPYESVETGWRHSLVLGGNIAAYVEAVRWFIQNLRTTNAYQTNRIKGFALFTTLNNGWQFYRTAQPELNELATMVEEEWTNVFPPIDPRAEGTDMSHWNAPINWQVNFNRGARFAFPKVTEGTTYIDPTGSLHIFGANEVGEHVAPYHFYKSDMDPIQQANHFATQIPSDLALPPVLDLEDVPGVLRLAGVNIDALEAKIEAIESTPARMGVYYGLAEELGQSRLRAGSDQPILSLADEVHTFLLQVGYQTGWETMIIYTSPGFWNAYIGVQPWQNEHDLWVAHWTSAPEPTLPVGFSTWKFWQWTSQGVGSEWGFASTRADLNRFNGDEADLQAYVESFAAIQPTTPRTVVVRLLPPVTTALERQAALAEAYLQRQTVSWSADDTADLVLAGLPTSKAIVYTPERWNGDILQWLEDHGVVNIETKGFPTITRQ